MITSAKLREGMERQPALLLQLSRVVSFINHQSIHSAVSYTHLTLPTKA